jgi:hypothetical protein
LARSLSISRGVLLTASACVFLQASPSAAQAPVAAATPPSAAPLVRLQYDAVEPPRLVALLVTRLRAELNVAGFSVALPAAADGAGTSASASGEAGGYADISITESGEQRVQLEIASRTLAASSHVVLLGGERNVPALALQATEFLRAGLVPRLVTSEPAPPSQTSAASPSPARDEPPGRFLVDVGATLLTNFRAGDRLALLSLGAGYAWPERASLRAVFDVPLASASYETRVGASDYRIYQGGLEADYAWLRWRGGEATLGLCAGVAKVTTVGRSPTPLEPSSPELWALTLGGRAAVEHRLSPLIAITASVRVLGLSPNPVVAILADERRLGSPSILFQLGARIGGR